MMMYQVGNKRVLIRPPIVALAMLTALGLAASPAWAMASTDILPDDEAGLAEMAQRLGWPEGTVALINDPLREQGWQFWFSELPNDDYTFGFGCGTALDVNRLIWLMSEIESKAWSVQLMPMRGRGPDGFTNQPLYPAVFQIGTQKILDEWFERLPVENGQRVFGVHRYTEKPTALCPTLTVYLGSGIVDVNELDVPPHVEVGFDPKNEDWSDLDGGKALERVREFIDKHKARQAEVKEPRPWRRVACPEWAKVIWPRELRGYEGRFALPLALQPKQGPIAPNVAGIDFWHANHTLLHEPQTHDYLYGDRKPFEVTYTKGLLPAYEAVVEKYTRGLQTDRDKAVTLVSKAMPDLVRHPQMPPLGPACPADRGADDEALLASGKGWCNEQARVFVRLCQVAGIPARLIFLWYEPPHGGHVVTEFYADGGWALADASWFCVFPDANGKLMSAAEYHGTVSQRLRAGRVYFERAQVLDRMSDEELVGRKFAHVANEQERREAVKKEASQLRETFLRRSAAEIAADLRAFSVMACPLPTGECRTSEPGRPRPGSATRSE